MHAASTVFGPDVHAAWRVFAEMFIAAALCLANLVLVARRQIEAPFAPVITLSSPLLSRFSPSIFLPLRF
jgi:hypothetical protein